MLSKNNKQLQQQKFEDRKQRFTIKRFSVGVASVLIGATFMMYGNASADQVASNEPTSTTTTNDALDNNEDGAASDTATLKVVNAEAQPTAADTDTKQTTTFDTTNTPNFTDEMLRESKVATSPATGDDRAATTPADQPMGSIVSSDPDKISTAGYSIETLPTPTLRPEASRNSDARAKFNVDSNPDHYTFAVIGDKYGVSKISGKKAYSVVFSTDTEGTGKLFVTFYDNAHKQLLQQELTDGSHTFSTYTISKSGNVVEWSKNDGYGTDETLYSWSTAQPTFTGDWVWQSDRYMIPTKVSAVSEYRDKNGTLLGTVTLTGMAGQKFTAPAKQTYDNYESEVVNQTGLTVSGDTLTGRLSNFKLGGENITLDQTGAVYEAVPGKVSDYYETMPPLVNINGLNVYDETKAVLKDPSQVTTDGKANGVVKVTRPGFDRPIYIGMDEQYYRYLGNDPKLIAGMKTQNATGYYEYNIYTGGTPSAVYDFESLATASATGVEVPLNTTPAVLTQKITDNVTVAQLPNEAIVVSKVVKDPAKLPATDTVGKKNPVTVVVTYQEKDGSQHELEVDVPVTVTDAPVNQNGEFEPQLEEQGVQVPQHSVQLTEDDIVAEVTVPNMPAGTTLKVKDPATIPSTDTVVTNKNVTVVVTYPDNSTDEIEVPVTVTPVSANGGSITVKQGAPAITTDDVTGKVTLSGLPEAQVKKTVKDATTIPSTSTPVTNQVVKVTVEYPNGYTEDVDVTVTVTPKDATTNEPKGQDLNTTVGNEPNVEDAITNKDDMPQGTTYEWKEKPDVSKEGDKPSTVVVNYPDGSSEEVDVTVHVTDPRPDNEKYDPKGQDVYTTINKVPNVEDAITNKDDMPKDTTYKWKETPNVSSVGDKPNVVVVTYPDGTQDEVPVTVHVTQYAPVKDPKGQDVTTDLNVKPDAEGAITNKDDMPAGTKYSWVKDPDVSTPGDKPSRVVVTYPDGSQDEVPVVVHVIDDATKYEPKGQDLYTGVNHEPNVEDAITNKDDMPKGTTYKWKDTPDVSTPGDKPSTVVVNYPDGSSEEVNITVHVTDDSAKYEPKGHDVDTDLNVTPKAEDSITNKDDMPDGTKYEWKETPDVSTPGKKPSTVVVTYPDGTQDEVPVTVNVIDDATKYEPKGNDINTDLNKTPKAEDSITNKDDMPDGTKYEWKDTPDVSTPGDKPSTVVVTYPDGSKEEVNITVHVTDDASKHEPKGNDIDTDLNKTPKAEDGITNKDDMPDGTKYEWKDTPDVSTPGDKPSTVVVTYPDGSKEEVNITVHVTDDASKHEPKGNDINTDLNKTPKAEDGITNKDDMPDGTKYEWKDTPDVSTPGDKPGVVVVTYPDGSKEEVPVTVHVDDDASKHKPKGDDIDTDLNVTPDASEGITNKDDMPDGTKYEWKETPDVSTPGDKPSTVVVTYPDGSKEEVPVTVHVTDDASKHEPKGDDIDTDLNVTPKAEDGITNKDDMPKGTTYEWKDTPDVSTPGDKPGVVVVTYPDGSKEEVNITVHVDDDASKYEPKGNDIDTDLNVTPKAENGITNKDDMPDGTKYEWKDTPDVSTPGDKPGVVVVTYPDGSKDEVLVTIHVTDDSEISLVVPDKTTVKDPTNLTDEEKQEVIDKIKESNKDNFPQGTKVEVENDGTATITYPDGSTKVIPGDQLVADKSNSQTVPATSNNGDAKTNEANTSSENTAGDAENVKANDATNKANQVVANAANKTKAGNANLDDKHVLPQTGEANENTSLMGVALVAAGSMFGLGAMARKRKEDK